MKLVKTLNNNVLIVKDEKGHEHIIIGRGIGFGKKPGDSISQDNIDRIFSSNNNKTNRLFDLIEEIPEQYLNLSEEMIEYAESRLNNKLNDSIYITLTDHIHFIIERYNKGIMPSNPLKWEIKRYYEKEYSIAEKSLELLEDEFEIELNDDEVASLAMHFVNAQEDLEMHQNVEVIMLIKEITKIIKLLIQIDIEEDDINFHRLVTHLKFFILRIKSESTHTSDNPLNDIIRDNYPKAYELTLRVSEFINKKLNYEVSADEITYLTIHIQRLIERKN